MTHDELVEKVTEVIANSFCCDRACCGNILDCDCKREARAAIAIVLEEAAKVAERAGRYPVGAGDGNTYVIGSASDAAAAIRKLKGDA
jgi:hypothetical protein